VSEDGRLEGDDGTAGGDGVANLGGDSERHVLM
jgi:hypothetical protein